MCGLLRSAGIECGHRVTQEIDSAFDNFAGDGPHEVIVHPADLEAARELLADTPGRRRRQLGRGAVRRVDERRRATQAPRASRSD